MQGILWDKKVKSTVNCYKNRSENIYSMRDSIMSLWTPDSHNLFVKTHISGHWLIMWITVFLPQSIRLSSSELRPRICILTNTPCCSYSRNTPEQWSQPQLHVSWRVFKIPMPQHTPNQWNNNFWRWDAGFTIVLSVPDDPMKLEWLRIVH